MSKARLLNKVIILSRKLNEVSEGAENLYYRLLVISDDFGCYHADPEIIKGQAYTLRRTNIQVIQKRLTELSEIKLIKTYKVNGESYLEIVKFDKYQYFRSDIKRKSQFPNFSQRSRNENVTDRIQDVTDCNVTSSPVNRNRNRNNNENEDHVTEIITYLNEKADREYKINSKTTVKVINARIKDGYSLADFKKVIDIKSKQWKNDSEMNKYLRPETLFGNKFEGYLNEKIVKNKALMSPKW